MQIDGALTFLNMRSENAQLFVVFNFAFLFLSSSGAEAESERDRNSNVLLSKVIESPAKSAKRPFNLVTSDKVPLYKYVRYIVNETEQRDPKVRDSHIEQSDLYTHIYLASLFHVDRKFSLVSSLKCTVSLFVRLSVYLFQLLSTK